MQLVSIKQKLDLTKLSWIGGKRSRITEKECFSRVNRMNYVYKYAKDLWLSVAAKQWKPLKIGTHAAHFVHGIRFLFDIVDNLKVRASI